MLHGVVGVVALIRPGLGADAEGAPADAVEGVARRGLLNALEDANHRRGLVWIRLEDRLGEPSNFIDRAAISSTAPAGFGEQACVGILAKSLLDRVVELGGVARSER